MKRTTFFALLGLALLLTLALGACGSDDEPAESSRPPDAGRSSSIELASGSDPAPVDPVTSDTQPGTGGCAAGCGPTA